MNTLTKQQAVLGLLCLIVAAVFLSQGPPAWMQHLVIGVALAGSYRLFLNSARWLRYAWMVGVAVCVVGILVAGMQLLSGQLPG